MRFGLTKILTNQNLDKHKRGLQTKKKNYEVICFTYKKVDKLQGEEMSAEFLKIRWQWNSYGNSSRILIRVLVGTFRVKYITQMTYEFFKNFDQNSG